MIVDTCNRTRARAHDGAADRSRRRAGVAVGCVLAVLAGCGAAHHAPAGQTSAGGSAAAKLTAADQAAFQHAEDVVRPYCASPHQPPPAAVTQAVVRLIAIYRGANPRAVAPGPLFAGQTAKQILADFGGLLNTGCAPKLGSHVGAALTGH